MGLPQYLEKRLRGFIHYLQDIKAFIEARREVAEDEKQLRDNLETASDLMDKLFRNKRQALSHVKADTQVDQLQNTLTDFELFMENDIQPQVDRAEKIHDRIQRKLNNINQVPQYHFKLLEGSEKITGELEEEIQRTERILNSSINKLDRDATVEEVAEQVQEFKVDTQRENVNKVQRNIEKINKLLDRNSLKTMEGWKRMLSRKRSRKLRQSNTEETKSGVASDFNTDF